MLVGRRKVVCNIYRHELEFGWVRASWQAKSHLHDLESCTGVWVGKTPVLLMGRREIVCNIWSHAQDFGWLEFPLAKGQEKSRLHDLESYTTVWVGKTPPLPKDSRKLFCIIYSHALEFGLVRFPPC